MTFITRPNSWIGRDAATSTTLTYAPRTDPAPVTASVSAEDPSLVGLEIVITNATTSTQNVSQVTITIPVGEGATYLTSTTSGIGTSVSDTTNWVFAQTTGTNTFVLQPAAGPSVALAANASVVVEIFKIQANTVPGTSVISIGETLTNSSGSTSFSVTTFPYGFYFNSLAATARSGSSLLPVAQVAIGSTVTLTWNGSILEPSAYRIVYSDPVNGQQTATPQTVGEWISPALKCDTMFTLWVSTPIPGGEPLVVSLSTSVSVQNPALTASSVSASGAITAAGAVKGIGICPPGTIVFWYGDINNRSYFDGNGTGIVGSAYQGWQVCNGANGSPDLRDRFIVGTGNHYTLGQTGGSNTVTLSIAQLARHSHYNWTGENAPYLNYQSVAFNSKGVSSGLMVNRGTDDPNGNRPNLTTTVNWPMVQVNSHSHSIPFDGSNEPHENRPPYYALAYLLRLA